MECLWFKIIWLHLVALRFMLCILPQTGLISEREFSESSEIMAADILEVLSSRPKYFNASHPAHTVLFPLLSSGLPFLLLQTFSTLFFSIITPYTLLLVPRIIMTFSSLVVDYLVYQISFQLYNRSETAHYACIMFASSSISWIFCTRTFIATYQLILLTSILFWIICKDNSHKQAIIISCLATLAIYIEVQYTGTVLLPLVFWLLSCRNTFVLKVISLLLGCFFTFTCLTLIDCFYFSPKKLIELFDTELQVMPIWNWFSKLSIVPYNQLKANPEVNATDFQSAKLFAFMFPLILFAFWKKFTQTNSCVVDRMKWYVNLLWLLVIANLLLVLISTLQDYYVLLPLTMPLVVLSSSNLNHTKHLKWLGGSWVVLNIFTFLFLGMANEGGMLPCIEYLHSVVKTHNQITNTSEITVLFYRTPTPPLHLVNWPASESTAQNKAKLQVLNFNHVEPEFLEKHINKSLQYETSVLYMIFPASISCETYLKLHNMYQLELYFEFFPHVTFIDPAWQHGNGCVKGNRTFTQLLGLLSLKMYRIQHLPFTKRRELHHTVNYKIVSQ